MPENYYSDAAPMPEEEPQAAEEEKEGADSATAVIPKALLAGKEWKPGDEIVLEIVQVNEDGAVVRYATEKVEKGEGRQERYRGGEEEMSSMNEGGGNPGMGGGY